jgi:hypothetical protein
MEINLLRDLAWIEAVGAIEGETVFLDLPEMGAVGEARVVSIGPCPEIRPGPGNVVTGTFHHEAAPDTGILSVTFANGAYIQGVTDNHPFYSVARHAYVPIGQMREGDVVQVNGALTRITKLDSRFAYPGEMLYNLETHNEHVYQVTTAGILVHNSCAPVSGVRFGQKGISSTFRHGEFAGKTIDEVAAGLRSGAIKPSQLPIQVVTRNGVQYTINNRSLMALRKAGLDPTDITDVTGIKRFEDELTGRLQEIGEMADDFVPHIRGGGQ